LPQPIDEYGVALPVRAGAIDLHAGQTLQRFRDVVVGHLADVLRGNRLDGQIGTALGVQRGLQRLAVAGDRDFRQFAVLRGVLRGRLRLVGDCEMTHERGIK